MPHARMTASRPAKQENHPLRRLLRWVRTLAYPMYWTSGPPVALKSRDTAPRRGFPSEARAGMQFPPEGAAVRRAFEFISRVLRPPPPRCRPGACLLGPQPPSHQGPVASRAGRSLLVVRYPFAYPRTTRETVTPGGAPCGGTKVVRPARRCDECELLVIVRRNLISGIVRRQRTCPISRTKSEEEYR
jgi:hypothetical protein